MWGWADRGVGLATGGCRDLEQGFELLHVDVAATQYRDRVGTLGNFDLARQQGGNRGGAGWLDLQGGSTIPQAASSTLPPMPSSCMPDRRIQLTTPRRPARVSPFMRYD